MALPFGAQRGKVAIRGTAGPVPLRLRARVGNKPCSRTGRPKSRHDPAQRPPVAARSFFSEQEAIGTNTTPADGRYGGHAVRKWPAGSAQESLQQGRRGNDPGDLGLSPGRRSFQREVCKTERGHQAPLLLRHRFGSGELVAVLKIAALGLRIGFHELRSQNPGLK